jgi:hypothetical protein
MLKIKPRFLYLPDPPAPAGDPPPPAPPAPAPDPAPGPVPYERFREVNEALKAAEKRLSKIEADQKAAAEKQAAEQGKWQQLAEQREAELKAEKLGRLRLEVAAKKGIPVDLVDRINGESAEEMEKDADSLLGFLKPKEGPGVPPPLGKGGGPTALDFKKMTPEEIRKATKGKPLGQFANSK